ncbi:MAG TPA: hypothetical protein PLU07_10060, partial [Ferruginibacter sp.]|nr:hypothetical protein [Ferruginibacter sp.]
YPAPFGNYYEGAKNQFLILASELTAAGLSAGNINSLAFDVVTPQVEPLKNFTIGIKHSALSALSTIETGFTNVYSNSSYVPSATGGYDNNTITFSAPFNWDGTSNIIIQVCFNNTFGDGSYTEYSTNAVFNQSTTSFVSSLVYRSDDFLGLCTSSSLTYSYSQRPNMRLVGSTTTDLTSGLTWEWNPGALSGNSVSVSPTATETYTVSATDANGCVATEDVEVTVNELPDAPIGTDSEHCGTLVPTAIVSTGGVNGNGVFNWYDAPTGGNLLQTGTDISYLTPISTTTTFYVSETGTNGCESERTPVNVTVIEADPLSLTATAVTSACVDAEITLEVTQDGGNNTYDFTYSADPDAGSGITGSETGTLVSVTPTAAGTYTYTVTGTDNDKGCTNVATAIITINPLPQITAASATPSTVCSGGDVQLSAVSIPAGVGNAQVGAGASTSSSSATPFYGGWGGTKVSYIYTAAELSAAGMVAGNINSLSLDVSTSVATIFKGFAIGIGTTTESVFTTSAHLPTTNVYNGPLTDNGYQTTAGINTFVFSSPFYWNGTSNIVVSFCYSNANSSNTAATIRMDTYTGQNKAVYTYADNKTPALVCAAVSGSVDGSGGTIASTLRAKTIFNAQVGVNLTSSLTWEWNPGAESGATVTVNPTTSTTYTVSATDANGCVDTEDVEVTVLDLPATPSATPSTQCGEGVPTASVSGGSGTFLWYDAATGGNLVQTGGSTYAGSLNTSTTFYVSESDGTCESERVAVEITVNAPDPITAIAADNSICIGEDVELSVSQDGSNQNYTYTWTATPEAGSGITGSLTGGAQTITPTAAGTYVYQVAGFDAVGPCNISTTVSVTVNDLPVITSATASPETICVGAISDLVAVSIPAEAGQATVGTGTGTSSTNGITPFGPNYKSTRMQYIVQASELTAAGLAPGNITSLSFNVTSGITFPLVNYTVKMAHTSATDLGTAFLTPTFTNVFADASFVTGTSTGWRELTFSTPFNWDGTSNIVIEICHDNSTCSGGSGVCWSGNASVEVTTTAYNSVFGRYADPTNMCAVDGSGSAIFTRNSRPNMRFNGQLGTDLTSGLNWTWNPGGFTTSSVTVSPTTTTTYTVSATDPVTGCASLPSEVTVTVAPVTVVASSNVSTSCSGNPVELSAVAGGGGPFSYIWSDGTNTVGTAAEITVNPTTTTTYTVTVTDVCNNSTNSQVTVTVNALPIGTINEATPISICFPATQTLTATSSVPNVTYEWYQDGNPIPNSDANSYEATEDGSYTVRVTDNNTGCLGVMSAAVVVTINPQPSALSITPASASICEGVPTLLTTSGGTIGGTGSGVITGTTPTTTTGAQSPFYRLFEGSRKQYLLRAAELQAMGMSAGSSLTSLSFNVTTQSRTTDLNLDNFNIKVANTSLTSLATGYAPEALTMVYSTASYEPIVGANLFNFSTPFAWDGTSSIVVEVCFDNDPDNTCSASSPVCWSNAATVSVATSLAGSSRYNSADNTTGVRDMCTGALGTQTASTSRPIMDITFTTVVPTSVTWSPQTGLFTNAAGTIPYTGQPATSVYAMPSADETYTAVATSVAGCSG